MKTKNAKVNKDVEALADDIRRVRNDLANLLWSARHRAKDLAAERRSKAREAAVHVEEPGQQEREVVVKRSGASARVLAVVFALGTLAAVLLMRRSKVIVTHPRQPRFRRVATRTASQEPAVEEAPLPGAPETVVREESRAEGLPLR